MYIGKRKIVMLEIADSVFGQMHYEHRWIKLELRVLLQVFN